MCVNLYIETAKGMQKVELNQESPIPLNYSLDSFTKTSESGGKLRAYYSSAISLPMNGVNCATLSVMTDNAVAKVRELLSTSPNALLECNAITHRGIVTYFGSQKVDGVTTIQIQFIGSSINFFNEIPQYLCDLPDFGCHVFSTASLQLNFQNVGPWDGSKAPYYYGLKHFGLFADDYVPLSQMRPDIHLSAIWKQIELHTGIRIVSQFFQTVFFRNLLLGAYVFESKADRYREIVSVDFLTDYTGAASITGALPRIPTNNAAQFAITDIIGAWDGVSDFQLPFDFQETKIRVKFHIEVDTIPFQFILFQLRDENFDVAAVNNTSDAFQITSPGVYDFELDFSVFNNDAFHIIGLGGIIKAGSYFTICAAVTKPTDGFEVCCNDFLGNDLKTVDFITGCIDLFNLKIMYDTKNEGLIIEPAHDYTIPVTGESGQGFFKASSTPTDLTGKIDCSKSEYDFTVEDVNRNVVYQFADDSADETTDENTLSETAILNGKFSDDTTENKNKFFAATTDSLLPSLPSINPNTIIVPTLFNYDPNDSGAVKENSYDFKPRILYKVGPTDGEWNFGTPENGFVALPQYPRVTQFDEGLGINLGYGDSGELLGMVSIFRYKDLQILNSGMVRRFDVLMKITDLLCLEDLFRNLAWIGVKGAEGRHIVQSIQMNLGDDVAAIELITYDI